MPRTDSTIDFDPRQPPFDELKGLHRLSPERSGGASTEHARHQLYVGTDKRTNTSVLIKIPSRPGLTYQETLSNEIASLLTINRSLPESRYFPVVLSHGQLPDGRVYVVVSFFTELPLATAIGEERIPGKTVSYIRTAMEIARAMGELHGLGIYHVDLNPMNVLLRLEQGTPIIRIIDFESSYERSRHSAGQFYNPPTTSGYSAPELSHQAPDARSDVFSLGAVLYTMLAGYAWTWRGDVGTCVSGDEEVDPELKPVLLRAVDPDPDNRYASMRDCHAGLAAYLERIWPGRYVPDPWPQPPVDQSPE